MAKSATRLRRSDCRIPWPDGLTLTQMLHQCGYLMSAIIQHDETPPAVQAALVEMLNKLRAELAALDTNNTALASIEAFHLFAPMVHSIAQLQEAA